MRCSACPDSSAFRLLGAYRNRDIYVCDGCGAGFMRLYWFWTTPVPYPVQQQVEVIQACGGLKTYLAGNRVNAETAFEQIYGSDWREFPGEAYLRDDWEEMYGRWEPPRAR